MILEHAVLNIKPGLSAAFEAAMAEALPLISASEGFLGMEVLPCIETGNRYLLLVRWTSVEAHDPGFRGSDRYPRWRALLHRFYDPSPTVEHYGAPVARA
ncbi:antibiotic biosynthesis monooxygenase [Microbaculum marinum]|uniref:Antibiotic biosynthesis monooxygenase n=1 Tax=Microbaculum marinum TaxID=1764581 RepID=A0AAW9RKB3_9HYPH